LPVRVFLVRNMERKRGKKMTDAPKLNTVLAEQYGWELKELDDIDAIEYINSIDKTLTIYITQHGIDYLGRRLHEIDERANIYIIEGIHSRSMFITKRYKDEDLKALNAKQLSEKRKNITEEEKELRKKFPKRLEDPWGEVIALGTRNARTDRHRRINEKYKASRTR
jgi:hypothetical protein